MQYNLQLDRDADAEIVVKQLTSVAKNAKLPLTLFGQGRPNYGQDLQNNFFYLLENFCGEDAPLNPAVGMLWYDSALKYLKLYTGETYPRGPWVKVNMVVPSSGTTTGVPGSTSGTTPSLTAGKNITWTTTGFIEASTNIGEVIGYLWAEIAGTTYKPNLVIGTDYVITNAPTGLIPKIDSSDTNFVLSFTGSAPSYSQNTATIKVSFNSSAFVGVSGNAADLIGNYSHESLITFIPPDNIVPKIINSFEMLTYITLKDINNKVYDIFVDTDNYGSYIIYDDTKTITSTGSLIELNNTLGQYKCIFIPKDLVISSDYTSFSQITKLHPKSVGAVDYKLVKYTVTPSGTLLASIDSSFTNLTINSDTKRIDDTSFIISTIPNGNNAQQLKIYNSTTNTSADYPSTALASSNIALLDTSNNGYTKNKQNLISKNTTYDVTFVGTNSADITINYNMTNKFYQTWSNIYPLHYKSNTKIPKQRVTFALVNNELYAHIIDASGNSIVQKIATVGIANEAPTSIIDERVHLNNFYASVILDVLYCGQNTTNTADVYRILTMNNNKKMNTSYLVHTVEVKNAATVVNDLHVTASIGESLFANNALTYQTTNTSKILYKMFYNPVTDKTGLFYQG